LWYENPHAFYEVPLHGLEGRVWCVGSDIPMPLKESAEEEKIYDD
jgi:hypothetical protein